MSYLDQESGERFIPFVIEPAAGVDRGALTFLLDAYAEDEAPDAKGKLEKRTVLRLDRRLAPVKAAVLPLSRNADLSPKARDLAAALRKQWNCDFDDASAIGRRYRRQDEIGTPFCVTVDFDTLEDQAVTVRDRDSMKQERVGIDALAAYLSSASAPADTWLSISAAAWWKPSGSPAAAMAAAISSSRPPSASPWPPRPVAAASASPARLGMPTPPAAASTPSARASARAASSSAADPLVQDAYAILTADAVAADGATRGSTPVPRTATCISARAAGQVQPGGAGRRGRRTDDAAVHVPAPPASAIAATSRPSPADRVGVHVEAPEPGTAHATSSAACGGQTEIMTASERR